MAEFNSCAKLVNEESYKEAEELYNKIIETGNDPLQEMLRLQFALQKDLHSRFPKYNPDPENLETMGDILDWLRKNKDAIDDEFRELLTSLGGMSNGEKYASAAWKSWKANHEKIREMKFDDHKPEDKLEILFELCDIFHFVLNWILGLKMSSKDLFILYYLKNKENFNRYKNNY